MCPYKRPYNSGTIRIRLLPSPAITDALTCGKRPVVHYPAPSFPASFRFPKPCAQVRILPGAPFESAEQVGFAHRPRPVNRHRRIVDEMSFKQGQEAAFCGFYPREVPGFLAEILNLEGGESGKFEGGGATRSPLPLPGR
jgi:hypothetical protein